MAVAEVGIRGLRRLHDQHLVKAHAEMAVTRAGGFPPAGNGKAVLGQWLIDSINHHEIVAQAVHFGEAPGSLRVSGTGKRPLYSGWWATSGGGSPASCYCHL